MGKNIEVLPKGKVIKIAEEKRLTLRECYSREDKESPLSLAICFGYGNRETAISLTSGEVSYLIEQLKELEEYIESLNEKVKNGAIIPFH